MKTISVVCANCGKEFDKKVYPSSRVSKNYFCSKKCHYDFGRFRSKCLVCGKEIVIPKYREKVGRGGIYCSHKCGGQANVREKNINWKGGRRNVGGYIYLLKPDHPNSGVNGYVAEHRLVMEKKLGRYLDPKEVIHHLNGKKADNREENLELRKNQSVHKSGEEAILRWVKENYGTLEKLQKAIPS